MRMTKIVALVLCGVVAVAGAATAEKIELKGRSTWSTVSEESITLADGRIVTRQVLRGTAIADGPKTPLSYASQDCMFTTTTSADGKSFQSGGSCDGMDADGDVYWAYGNADENGGRWYYQGGTGKFEGLTGGGTYQLSLRWPDGKVMATWDGTAEMK